MDDTTLNANLAELPQEIIDEIRNSDLTSEIYPVTGFENFDGKILKANEIVFDSSSVLSMGFTKGDFVAVVAKKLRFRSPAKRATITRSMDIVAGTGTTGSVGTKPADQPKNSRTDDGFPGHIGGQGGTGGIGGTSHLPIIYIIAGDIEGQAENEKPDFINFRINYPGIDGGTGGLGGIGSQGGRGGSGGDGVDALLTCMGGPGDGGQGGMSGKWGIGGTGGKGGNGAGIVLVGPDSVIDLLTLSAINNVGGQGGHGGLRGSQGGTGEGGPRGARTVHCKGGSGGGRGYTHREPEDINTDSGQMGIEGTKGKVFRVIRVVDDLF